MTASGQCLSGATGEFRPEAGTEITNLVCNPALLLYVATRNASSTRAKAGEGCLRLGLAADRHPLRLVVVLVIQYQSNRSLTDFRGILRRCLHGSILSRVGASGKAGGEIVTSAAQARESGTLELTFADGAVRVQPSNDQGEGGQTNQGELFASGSP